MNVSQDTWTEATGWRQGGPASGRDADLLLLFGAPAVLANPALWSSLDAAGLSAKTLGCSTAGEIAGPSVQDNSVVATAIGLKKTRLKLAARGIAAEGNSYLAGRELAMELMRSDLVHVFVVSDGTQVNGTALVAGLSDVLPAAITVTGGLAGDGDRFRSTLIACGDRPKSGLVAAVGFYGSSLRVACGSMGGWDPFGPDRLITRSEQNVLFELDGKSALDLYKLYLGDYARDLPASGLLFPLLVRAPGQAQGVVRTILAIDERAKSMTFAGDMPRGAMARLMRANFDRLIDGATDAARSCAEPLGREPAELALLISCVGRKLVLRQRVDEEVEAVRSVLGPQPVFAGFYSYGEISPFTPGTRCDLHNQTMTVTTLRET